MSAAIVMSASADISDISGAAVVADAKVGANGGDGSPELDVGTGVDYMTGRLTWDGDLSDGFGSPDVVLGLATNADGATPKPAHTS